MLAAPALGAGDRKCGCSRPRWRCRLEDLRALLASSGLRCERVHQLNKIGALSWALYGGLLRRRSINKLSLKIFDKTVWLWRRLDPPLPWPGLSLVAVARKPG